ncbi:MAG: hypothetical protein J7K46_03655 [Bacteroidales bacterium]|nr:hypothetical protein [Bacteroidales bacterium]
MGKKVMIGYCPTMQGIAKELDKKNKNENLSFVPLGSAAEALYYLKADQIQGALIGRIAKNAEITPDTRKVNLQEEGYTIVSWQKGFIDRSSLPDLPVVTYVPESVTREILPEARQIIFVKSEKEMISHMNDHVGLIPWSDYKDKYDLLIPMEGGDKMIRFRLPVIYYKEGNKEIFLSLVI